MSKIVAPTPRSAATKIALLIVLAVALLGRLCYLAEPFDGDSATFLYLGKITLNGGIVGCEVIDNKLPTVGLVMSILWRGFGMHWAGYVVLEACLSIGGALILSRAAAKSCGPAAAIPALLFALIYLNFTDAVYSGLQLETIEAFFAILAAATALRVMRTGERS